MSRTRRRTGPVFGVRGGGDRAAFPKVRVVTVSECGSHAPVLAAVGPAAGGKGSGEQALARQLYPRPGAGLAADRRPGLLLLEGLAHGGGYRGGAAVAGQGERAAAGAGDAARRLLPVGPDQAAADHREEAGAPDRRGPARRRTGGGRGPVRPGDRVRRPGPGRATARTSSSPWSPPSPTSGRPRRRRSRGPTTSGGSTRPATPSSRHACAARAGYCAPGART